jgi:hypothetical protein
VLILRWVLVPFGPSRKPKENRMAFAYRLEHEDGTRADPPAFRTSVSAWKAGDTIPLGRGRSLRVTLAREEGEEPALVVEPASIDATP